MITAPVSTRLSALTMKDFKLFGGQSARLAPSTRLVGAHASDTGHVSGRDPTSYRFGAEPHPHFPGRAR